MQSAARPDSPRTADATVYSRDTELAAVRGLLADPGAGARALVLVGEAGIGKTTLWSAGVEAARGAGWTVLTARGAPEESGLSFAGLMDLMESLPDSALAALPGIQRAAVEAALLRAAPTTAVGPLEVGAGTLAVLRLLCRDQPVLVAVDDLQWLDEPTTDALWFAVRRLGSAALRILAAYRTAGVADDESYVRKYIAADDIPLESVERLKVGPLGSEPIRKLISDRFPAALPAGAADRIAEQTGGNPFWALEVGAALAAEPGAGRNRAVAASELPIPPSLSALVRRRLGSLEPEVHEVLLTVAMLDQPTIALARRVLAPAVPAPDAAIDRAVAAGVVAALSGRLRVAHPLLSAAVVDATPPLARGALHRRLSEVVQDPELRARHVLRAWQGEADEHVAGYLEAGSASAAARGAVRSAAELAERAADCTPADAVDDRCRRLRVAAELHLRVGDYQQARVCAEAVWRTGAEDRRRALPVLVEATWWAEGRHQAEGFVAPLAADTGLDPHTRAVVLALAADVGDGRGTPRAELARRSLELFDQVGAEADGAALATALLYSALADLEAGRGIAFDRMNRIGELQRELPYVVSSNRADNVIASWYKDVDDLNRSRVALLAAIAANQDLGDEPMLASLYGHLALTEVWAGRPAAARGALDRGIPLISADAGKPVGMGAAEATLTLFSDSIGITRPHIDRLPGGGVMVASLTGLAALLDGDDEAAAEILGAALAKARQAGVHEPGRRGRFEGNLGQALVNLGRLEEARELAAELIALGTGGGRYGAAGGGAVAAGASVVADSADRLASSGAAVGASADGVPVAGGSADGAAAVGGAAVGAAAGLAAVGGSADGVPVAGGSADGVPVAGSSADGAAAGGAAVGAAAGLAAVGGSADGAPVAGGSADGAAAVGGAAAGSSAAGAAAGSSAAGVAVGGSTGGMAAGSSAAGSAAVGASADGVPAVGGSADGAASSGAAAASGPVAHPRPTLLGIGLRIEGLALGAEGDLDAAVRALEAAVVAHRSSQFPVELGRSLLALGQIQRRRKERPAAGEALRAALDCFETAGAVPFADLVRAELGKGRRGAGGETLTPTEQQVADLVAAGHTNREVAARLFISIRTVETHLAAVYRKLGVRSRSELAARHR